MKKSFFIALLALCFLIQVSCGSNGQNDDIEQLDPDSGVLKNLIWDLYTVDNEAQTGFETSIAVDSAGNPGITYYQNDSPAIVKYAYHQGEYTDGTEWTITDVSQPGESNNLGYAPLAFYQDNPVVSLLGFPDHDLYFYSGSTGSFSVPSTIDATGWSGMFSAITVSQSNNIGVAYQLCFSGRINCNDTWSSERRSLQFASSANGGGSWNIEMIEGDAIDSNSGFYNSVVFDNSGNPAIAFFNKTQQAVKFARRVSGSWTITEIDNLGLNDMYISVDVDSNNNFAVTYYDEVAKDLKYAFSTDGGSSWEISYVNRVGSLGKYCSLKFDHNDNPGVAYYDSKNYNLRYSYLNGDTWEHSVVDNTDRVGRHSSLAYSYDASRDMSIAMISYHDITNSSLKFAILVPDVDEDGVADRTDNCPNDQNFEQLDTDGDGIGDVCDTD